MALTRGWVRISRRLNGQDPQVDSSARWMVDERDGLIARFGTVSNETSQDLPVGFGGVQLQFSEEASLESFVCAVTYQSSGQNVVAQDAVVHSLLLGKFRRSFGAPTSEAEVGALWENAYRPSLSPEVGYLHQRLTSKLPPGVRVRPQPGDTPADPMTAVAYTLLRGPRT